MTGINKPRTANDSRNVMQTQLVKKKKASSDSHSIGNLNKTEYLSEFDSIKNGPFHDQSWAKSNMNQFHKSMQYLIFQCTVCQEAWPIKTKPKCPDTYVCLQCSRDKKTPKKFSDANAMIPALVPVELQGLTLTEEMLIARALPMRVYVKPGGQRRYSGHCINMPQHIEELVLVLPRYPKDLSIIIVKMKGQEIPLEV